ncbi:hypothetical protein Ddye_009416 [Dipteronia dyeriana]|uniref:Zinc finger GRF-type domain-containing protein n=1 Tax=Dipteronia dyeriana TaxID=168575 RepID=A0AAE0CMC2_9ROSI|nr:hypothetical protein Ddye_009416 [Dipteronia dyeriana]
MEATSSSTNNINGVFIKFKNRRCLCGVKASVKFYESQNNPHKLYFVCEKWKCKFYNFWSPNNEEFNIGQLSDSVSQRNDGRGNALVEQEMTILNGRVQRLEMLWERLQYLESFHGRIQQLESMPGGSKLIVGVNLVLLGIIIAMLLLK